MKTINQPQFDAASRTFVKKILSRPPLPAPESHFENPQTARIFLGDSIVEIPIQALKKAGWRREW